MSFTPSYARTSLQCLPKRSPAFYGVVRRAPAQLSQNYANTRRTDTRSLSTTARLFQGPNVQQTTGTTTQDSSVEAPDYLSEGELHVFTKLKQELEPVRLEVQDISGGCGSMYGLDIVSPKFKGLSVIKQHQMVNRILKEEIGNWHGVQLKTKAP